jgi:hypothetical protein
MKKTKRLAGHRGDNGILTEKNSPICPDKCMTILPRGEEDHSERPTDRQENGRTMSGARFAILIFPINISVKRNLHQGGKTIILAMVICNGLYDRRLPWMKNR